MKDATRLVGAVIDRQFKIEAVLGAAEGGGFVFRARDVSSGALASIRCPAIPDDLSGIDLERALDAFVAEAKLLQRASEASDDVEQLLAFGIAETQTRTNPERVPFCVFEWLEGKSLEQLLTDRGHAVFSVGEAMAILEPAARALAAAHNAGVAHKDVRPPNLWLANVRGGRTRMKLTQFVLASRIGTAPSAFAPEYGAPEHFKSSYGPLTPPTDVYGLALSLIEVITGKRALTSDPEDEVALYLETSDLARRPTLRAKGAHVSDAVEAVFARALAVDPKRRWQNARDFWEALVTSVPELTPSAPSIRPRPEASTEGEPAPADPSVAPPAPEPPSSAPSVSAASSWPAAPGSMRPREPSIVIGAEDARLGESAKVPAFSRPPPRRGDRAGLAAWLGVGIAAILGIGVVGLKLGRSAATPSAPLSSVASVPSVGAVADAAVVDGALGTAPTGSVPARSEETAVRFQPFLTDMILVPAGTFTMGTDREGRGDGPAHPVKITKAFYIDRTEVTADVYSACVEEGACPANRVHGADGTESTWGCNTAKDHPRHPANCVDRTEAERFCGYVQKRLPTEAEWEYAARGSDSRAYPWGNTPPASCASAIIMGLSGACRDQKGPGEVGQTAQGRSAFGALDMAGNVWEWVADGYTPYPSTEVVDPKAEPSGRGVLRGGSWDYSPLSAKTTYRLPYDARAGNISIGFRCARDGE